MKPRCAHLSCGCDLDFLRGESVGGGAVAAGRRERIRATLAASAGFAALSELGGAAQPASGSGGPADTVLINGRIATLNGRRPFVSALAIRGEKIIAGGSDAEVAPFRGADTRTIDLGGRTVVPGLNDAHSHFIRGGLTYSNEVRWDGVPSLADALRMVREQARRTPAPHWVQVIGGWSTSQFAEKRFPTLEEINAATGEVPAMIMHLYDRAWLNRAAMRVLGWNKDTPNPFAGTIERDRNGNPTGLLMATTSLAALVGVWLQVPRLSPEDQILSTRHFMRECNRLGMTSVIDAGGGGQNYPENYQSVAELARRDQLTMRVAYTLFAQSPGKEIEDYRRWAREVKLNQGDDWFRMIGAGEYLVWQATDVTNFAKDFAGQPSGMEALLTEVVKYVAELRWPFHLHASYDSSCQRILGVLERVHREVPIDTLRWSLEHCEGISAASLERVAAMGGSIGIQNRLSLDGEQYLARQGAAAAADSPPIGRMRSMDIPFACGTDGNRATSHNPWIAIHWMLTGETVGGLRLNTDRNLVDRTEALRLFTHAGAWMSYEENTKGTLEPGRLADLAVLSADYFNIADAAVKSIESVLTMAGGKIVYAARPFSSLSPPPLPVTADWLPTGFYAGYHRQNSGVQRVSVQQRQPLFVPGWPGLECSCAF